jgi:hypothetical protein
MPLLSATTQQTPRAQNLWCLLKNRARSPMGATRLESKHLGIAAILTATSNGRVLKIVGSQNLMAVTMLQKKQSVRRKQNVVSLNSAPSLHAKFEQNP